MCNEEISFIVFIYVAFCFFLFEYISILYLEIIKIVTG